MIVTMALIILFTNFARCEKNDYNMTQKQAVEKALGELGGRAKLPDIYLHVIKLLGKKSVSEVEAPVRALLQRNPLLFRSSPDKPKGWWELVSFQEDIAKRNYRIKELEEENARLKAVKTEDDFVHRFVDKVKHNLKRDKKTVEEIRKLMDALGRPDADKELDEWLQGKDKKVVKKIVQKNINSQVFTGDVMESEFKTGEVK